MADECLITEVKHSRVNLSLFKTGMTIETSTSSCASKFMDCALTQIPFQGSKPRAADSIEDCPCRLFGALKCGRPELDNGFHPEAYRWAQERTRSGLSGFGLP